ncbi:MAG: serine/threonine-protein kinase [Myxococcota bacterium]
METPLGEGANAVVYLVSDTKGGKGKHQHFAMKVFRRMDSRRSLRIEQEVVFREALRHPHVVRPFDVLEVDGAPALLMEYVEGPNLQRWLEEDQNADLGERLDIFRKITEGLRYAHGRGIVHRDLKPSNILLQPGRDGKWSPRITDFGLAKALAPEVGKYGGLTTVNTGLGTVGYAAPEQVRDAAGVDHRADLYSLGCILYELVCGLEPFAGLSAFDTLQAQRDSRYRRPEEMAPGLPPGLYDLIRQLMSTRPDARPNDAEEVLRRVDAVIDALGFAPTAVVAPKDGGMLNVALVASVCSVPVLFLLVGSAVSIAF